MQTDSGGAMPGDSVRLTDDEVRAALERAERATPGPWESIILDVGDTPNRRSAALNYVDGCIAVGGEDFYIVLAQQPDGPADVCHPGNGPTSPENADFIGHARTDVPALAAEVLELRAENAKLREADGRWRELVRDMVAALWGACLIGRSDGKPYFRRQDYFSRVDRHAANADYALAELEALAEESNQ